jgi:hypothetical protein
MADRAEAARLDIEFPNLTWEQIVQKGMDQGYEGDDLWNYIIGSSQRSNPDVDIAVGIDPNQ